MERHVPAERILISPLRSGSWAEWNGTLHPCESPAPATPVLAFSAIGAPESFARFLRDEELRVVSERRFKDYHRYRSRDLEELDAEWARRGAEFLSGTEKDIYNLPADWRPPAPLRVLGDPERFAKMSAAGDGVWVRPGPWYVVEYAASALGWDVREALYEKLMKTGLH